MITNDETERTITFEPDDLVNVDADSILVKRTRSSKHGTEICLYIDDRLILLFDGDNAEYTVRVINELLEEAIICELNTGETE